MCSRAYRLARTHFRSLHKRRGETNFRDGRSKHTRGRASLHRGRAKLREHRPLAGLRYAPAPSARWCFIIIRFPYLSRCISAGRTQCTSGIPRASTLTPARATCLYATGSGAGYKRCISMASGDYKEREKTTFPRARSLLLTLEIIGRVN